MFSLATLLFLFLYVITTIATGYGFYKIGRYHLRIKVWMWSQLMSNAKFPKAIATNARRQLEVVEGHLADADRELEQVSKRDLSAARARTSIWQALWALVQVPGMRADNGENGNGQNGNGEHE